MYVTTFSKVTYSVCLNNPVSTVLSDPLFVTEEFIKETTEVLELRYCTFKIYEHLDYILKECWVY
jgi:hypothetical protein